MYNEGDKVVVHCRVGFEAHEQREETEEMKF